jgi:hypothetical protein
MVTSAAFLTVVRFLAEAVMERVFGWPINNFETKNAAASAAAIVHSMNLVPVLISLFLNCSSYNPSQPMKLEKETWWRDTATAMLQFTTGYMIYDGLLNIIWLKTRLAGGISSEDYMFLGHHLATTFYMTAARIVGAGHQSAMMCMLLGEWTNPLHNGYYIAEAAQRLDCCNGSFSRAAFAVIECSFASFYCFMRAVIAPVIMAQVSWNLWATGWRKGYLPLMLVILWTLMIWGVLLGSIPWIVECWGMLQNYLPVSMRTEEL